jgi:hypothetical protein
MNDGLQLLRGVEPASLEWRLRAAIDVQGGELSFANDSSRLKLS